MANDVEIKGKITVDSAGAGKSINEVKDAVKEATKAFHDAKQGTDEYVAAQKRLQDAQAELKKVTDEANGSTSKSAEAFGVLKEKLGSTVPGFKAAESGTMSLGTAFKALAANPVILILTAFVLVLKGLYNAFTSTREGAQKVEQVFAWLGGAVDKVTSVVGGFINNIKSAGDFMSKIGSIIAHPIDSFKKLAKEVGAAADETARLKKEQQKLEIDTVNNIARNKDLIRQEEALKNIRDNEFNSTKDRIAANEQAAAIEKQRLKVIEDLQIREVERHLKIVSLQGGINKASVAQLKELREAEAQLADIREESIGRENEFITNRYNLQKEADDKKKALHDAEVARWKENAVKAKEHADKIKKIAEDQAKLMQDLKTAVKKEQLAEAAQMEKDFTASQAEEARINAAEEKRLFDNEKIRLTNKTKLAELDVLNNPKSSENKIAKIKADLALELQALAEGDVQRSILAKKASDAIIKIQDDETKAKKELRAAELASALDTAGKIGEGFGTLSELAGKQTATGKALAVAQASITAIQGAINSFTSLSSIPIFGPALGAIAAAGAIAAGIANIKKINAVQIPGKSGGGGSMPSIATAAPPVTPQQMSTKLNQSTINSIGNAAAGGINRAFVLDRDIKDNQERAATIQRASRIG